MAKHDRASVTATAELEFEEVIAEDECSFSPLWQTLLLPPLNDKGLDKRVNCWQIRQDNAWQK